MRTIFLALVLSAGFALANPLLDGADPHVLQTDGTFWMFPTESRSRKPIFAAYRSTDLRKWKRTGPILELDDIRWVTDAGRPYHAWAPAMIERGGKFYFYYSVGPQSENRPSRIGVAVGNSPDGKFIDSGKALLTGGDGFEAIDPMVFIDPVSNKTYFYAGGSAGSKLRVFELAEDMVTLGSEIKVATPEKFTEAPFMHRHGEMYYLSYSHGSFNRSSYSVHYATAPSPIGPWKYRGAILESDAKHQGPGHHSFVENPKTKSWHIIYHRWDTTEKPGPFKGTRKIAAEKIEYDQDGLIRPIRMTD